MIFTQVKNLLTRLHNNENGDIPVGPILVIGLVVIPLVIAIMVFGEQLVELFKGKWDDLKNEKDTSTMKFGE